MLRLLTLSNHRTAEACKILNYFFQFGMNKVPNKRINADAYTRDMSNILGETRRRLCADH